MFHEPLWGAGCSGNSNIGSRNIIETILLKNNLRVVKRKFGFVESGHVLNLVGRGDEDCVGVGLEAMVEEDSGVAGFLASDEDDKLVCLSKLADVLDPIGDVSADGVVELKRSRCPVLDEVDEMLESLDGFGGLAEENDGPREVDLVKIVLALDDDGVIVGLSAESDDFGMSGLSVDDDLCVFLLEVCLSDSFLEFEDDGTGCVGNGHAVSLCDSIGGRWLSVCSEEDVSAVEGAQVVVVDGLESEFLESIDLFSVVYDVSEAIERASRESVLSLSDGICHAEAKTAMWINGYVHQKVA